MTTQLERGTKILAYDGDCPMCLRTVGMLVGAGLIAPEQAQSNHSLSPADLAAAQAAGIHNQLVVIDPLSRETRSGSDALLWIIGEHKGHPLWIRLLGLPGIRQLLSLGYETISYNRRVISPPRHRVRCDCEPEVTVARRLTLAVPLVVIAALITAAFGAAVFYGIPEYFGWTLGDAAAGAWFMPVAVGSGWVVMGLAALVLLRGEQRVDYIAHLAVTMFVGALVLLPATLVMWWLPREANIAITWLSVLVSFALMFAMQRRRVAAVGLSRWWLWDWVAALAIGSAAWKAVYFLVLR